MAGGGIGKSWIDGALVAHDGGRLGNVRFHDRAESFGRDVRNVERAHMAFAFDE